MSWMNLRDVSEDVHAALAQAAEANRQSLNEFVVDRLTEVAQTARLAGYRASFPAPQGTGVSLDDAGAAGAAGARSVVSVRQRAKGGGSTRDDEGRGSVSSLAVIDAPVLAARC